MATLSDKLTALIATQQGEVDRLQTQAVRDLAVAQARLAQLQTLLTQVTPELETAYVAARQLGIQLDT